MLSSVAIRRKHPRKIGKNLGYTSHLMLSLLKEVNHVWAVQEEEKLIQLNAKPTFRALTGLKATIRGAALLRDSSQRAQAKNMAAGSQELGKNCQTALKSKTECFGC